MRGGERVTALTAGTGTYVIDGESGVVMLDWPERREDLEQLARRGTPRLLLVSPNGVPPMCTDALEDWIRLPADDIDLQTRLRALAERVRKRMRPTVDAHRVLRLDGALVLLSPYEHRLASVLIESFGEVVPNKTIEQALWSEMDASRVALRVHASRLRKRIDPLGLTISSVIGVGYVMHRASEPDTRSHFRAKARGT